MRNISTLLASLPFALIAQTTWQVEAGGSLTDPNNLPYYDPMDLVIEVGDAVNWTNVGGTHNIYGELDMFPDNPEGFGNGDPAQAPWTFSYTFTIPGVYGYHCTQEFNGQLHSTTQHGEITVVDPSAVHENTALGNLLMFPVPVDGQLSISLEGASISTVEVMSIDGRLLLQRSVGSRPSATLDLSSLASGRFVIRLTNDQGLAVVRPFVKN
ncbi:MAG: T9SS type A sorting domain-containing protein [Flavobacteriales bacterium]|nr:T9SS type A sorting domain-containing protein [Flavobacteriales bacterium]